MTMTETLANNTRCSNEWWPFFGEIRWGNGRDEIVVGEWGGAGQWGQQGGRAQERGRRMERRRVGPAAAEPRGV